MLADKVFVIKFRSHIVRMVFICSIFCLQGLNPASADMVAATDNELAAVTAGGFSRFTVNGDIIRADFDISTWTYTEIASLKLGFYDNGITGQGWDNDWTSVQFGSPAEDLSTNGIYFEVEFENLNNPATRVLKSVKFGAHEMTGTIAAAFNSFSGNVGAGVQNRAANPFSEIILDHSGGYISITLDGPEKGIQVHFDNAVTK